MAFRPMVFVENSWCGNGLVFATKAEAEASAKNLARRWYVVEDTRADETDAAVNYVWVGDVNGKLEAVEVEGYNKG